MISKNYGAILTALITFESQVNEYICKSINVDFKYINMCKARIKQILDRNVGASIDTVSAYNKIMEFYNIAELKEDRVTKVDGNNMSEIDFNYIPNMSIYMQFVEEKIDILKNIPQIDKSDIKSALKFWNKWLDNWTDTIV